MAKKLKYPYQQWKETKQEQEEEAKTYPGSYHQPLASE